MKTKMALFLGIICSVVMIGYSIYQGNVVHEEKRNHQNQLEEARRKAELYGGTVQQTSGLTSYAKATRTAGKVVMGITVLLLASALIGIKLFRKNKGLFIFHIIGMIVVVASLLFSVVMMTSSGGATFDETFVVWVLFGMIEMILYIVSIIRLPKMELQYS